MQDVAVHADTVNVHAVRVVVDTTVLMIITGVGMPVVVGNGEVTVPLFGRSTP